jgi:hypothetical protein
MTKNYAELSDAFERYDIDPGAFTHADHVDVAYQMLSRYDFLEALTRYSQCINTIASAAGAAHKFNVTITLTFLSIVVARMRTTEHTNYAEFLKNNPEVLNTSVLKQWYSSDQLASELVRTVFLMPKASPA